MIPRLLALMSLAMPAMARDFSLIPPIDCDLQNDCHIQQFVDRDPTEAARDFTCAALSYDGHKGTDFAVPTLARMREGVWVVASAAGVVRGVRRDMPDTGFTRDTAAAIKGKECGNGVIVDHPNGWQTQYCHLRQNSVRVAPGQTVKAGDVLGQVGMSGRAQFPHVHLSVRKEGQVIDPFDPDGGQCGETPSKTLWQTTPAYRAGGLITAGVAGEIPEYAAIKAGEVPAARATSRALVVWAYGFGFRAGDTLALSLEGPAGEVVSEEITLEKAQAQAFRAAGRKARGNWPAGPYRATARLIRDGAVLDQTAFDVVVE